MSQYRHKEHLGVTAWSHRHTPNKLIGSKKLSKKSVKTYRAPHWKPEPDEHDYPAARDYLELLFREKEVDEMVNNLEKAPVVTKHAKDILRASNLKLLPASDLHVAVDLRKVRKGIMLSPVLLVRGDGSQGAPLVVADGYHRVCASYLIDEDSEVPCRIAEFPPKGPSHS